MKKSKNPRKDIGAVLCGQVMAPFELSDKDFRDIEAASGVSLANKDQRFLINFHLGNYISFTKSIQNKPTRQAVRAQLEEWRKCAETLYFSTVSHDPAPHAAMERLQEIEFDEEKAHLWIGAEFGTETRMRLCNFFLACEKAISDIDQKTATDKGGQSGDEQRDILLSSLEKILLDAGGKKQFRKHFIRSAIEKLPEDTRPNLPNTNGEILKIINAARRKWRNRGELTRRKGE